MDKKSFDSRYRDLVLGQMENFGKKETAVPGVGRTGCKQVVVALPLESVRAFEAIAKQAGLQEANDPLRIAEGLSNSDALKSELSNGTGAGGSND